MRLQASGHEAAGAAGYATLSASDSPVVSVQDATVEPAGDSPVVSVQDSPVVSVQDPAVESVRDAAVEPAQDAAAESVSRPDEPGGLDPDLVKGPIDEDTSAGSYHLAYPQQRAPYESPAPRVERLENPSGQRQPVVVAALPPVVEPLPATVEEPAAGAVDLQYAPVDSLDDEAAEDGIVRLTYPASMMSWPDEKPVPEAPTAQSGASTGQTGQSPIEQAKTLGQAPDYQPLEFLRRETVLLKQGQWQFDAGLTYTITDRVVPVVVGPNAVVRGRLRQRLLLVPFQTRYGLTDRIQLFLSTPVGWGNSEFSIVGLDQFDNKGGIADIRGGASIELIRGEQYSPEVIGTIGFTAPTGDYTATLGSLTPGSSLGEGFWAASGTLLFVHTYDPVTLFYGFGVRQRFENRLRNLGLVEPGTQFLYQFGLGFAINERITLSTSFNGMYISEYRLNHQHIEGTIQEPLRLRFAVTISRHCRIIEPFAEIGMTDDAPAATAGIVWTF